METTKIPGIHHITAMTSDAQKNIDFYCGVLGLRLVKLTVNFDDPGTYHLYYGDETGSPGSILTFFAWPGAFRGKIGSPQVVATSFAVPVQSIEYWSKRLNDNLVRAEPVLTRFGEKVLRFADFDGMAIELIATANPAGKAPTAGPVPPDFAIRGIHSATIAEVDPTGAANLLTELFGYQPSGEEEGRLRFKSEDGVIGNILDLISAPYTASGGNGAGSVHHIALRARNDPEQIEWQARISGLGLGVSPVMDRSYFHSIYFREPGGVLFEIATDQPGFTVDEALLALGSTVRLPSWLEPQREKILASLPKVTLASWFKTA